MADARREPVEPALRRHELLWLTRDAWAECLADRPDLSDLPLIADWVARHWPVIVRRRLEGDPPDRLPVGLPLPPAWGKGRVALSVSACGVTDRRSPLPLSTVAASAPGEWQPAISSVLAIGEALRLEPAVFGSLLWQHLTGLSYVTPSSDLDLLWSVSRDCPLPPLLAALAVLRPPPRLDGEIELPDDTAVNWRELWRARDGDSEVLAKTHEGLRLVPASSLLASKLAA